MYYMEFLLIRQNIYNVLGSFNVTDGSNYSYKPA